MPDIKNLTDLLRNNECKVKYDMLYDDHWNDDELLFHIVELNCSFGNLADLPDLLNCKDLNCSFNYLTNLPKLPKCFKNINNDVFYNIL